MPSDDMTTGEAEAWRRGAEAMREKMQDDLRTLALFVQCITPDRNTMSEIECEAFEDRVQAIARAALALPLPETRARPQR